MPKDRYKAIFHLDGNWDVNYQLTVKAKDQAEAIAIVKKEAKGAYNINVSKLPSPAETEMAIARATISDLEYAYKTNNKEGGGQ